MLNVGPPELLLILLIALLVLGPSKLPEAARQVGRAMAELRRLSSGFQAEMRDAMQEPIQRSPTPLATPAPPEPDDHEAMNAALEAARQDAVTAQSQRRREPLRSRAAKKAPAASTKAPAAKKEAPAKKKAPAANRAAAAKKAPAVKKKQG